MDKWAITSPINAGELTVLFCLFCKEVTLEMASAQSL
jgi:hypothetical protein